MLWNLKESSVTVGGSRVDYAVFGRGSKALVIIPGLSLRDVRGAGAGLAWMYRRFAKDYRIYVLDKKVDIPEGCTVADLARDTVEALQTLGIHQASYLGVSLGGMIAQEIAIAHPEMVERLILGVTASRTNHTMQAVVGNWIELAERGDFGGIVLDMLTVMYSARYAKRYRWIFPLLAKYAKPKNEERFIRLAKACLTCEAYDRLGEIKAPTLVLGGEADRIVTGEASREIAARLGCEIYMYEELGHAAYEEAADFNERIERFLKA